MLLVLTFEFDADIIDVPPGIIENKDELKDKFYDWLFDKNNHHKYWANEKGIHDGSQYGVVYRSDAFLEWLNTRVLLDCDRASLVKQKIDDWDRTLPFLWF